MMLRRLFVGCFKSNETEPAVSSDASPGQYGRTAYSLSNARANRYLVDGRGRPEHELLPALTQTAFYESVDRCKEPTAAAAVLVEHGTTARRKHRQQQRSSSGGSSSVPCLRTVWLRKPTNPSSDPSATGSASVADAPWGVYESLLMDLNRLAANDGAVLAALLTAARCATDRQYCKIRHRVALDPDPGGAAALSPLGQQAAAAQLLVLEASSCLLDLGGGKHRPGLTLLLRPQAARPAAAAALAAMAAAAAAAAAPPPPLLPPPSPLALQRLSTPTPLPQLVVTAAASTSAGGDGGDVSGLAGSPRAAAAAQGGRGADRDAGFPSIATGDESMRQGAPGASVAPGPPEPGPPARRSLEMEDESTRLGARALAAESIPALVMAFSIDPRSGCGSILYLNQRARAYLNIPPSVDHAAFTGTGVPLPWSQASAAAAAGETWPPAFAAGVMAAGWGAAYGAGPLAATGSGVGPLGSLGSLGPHSPARLDVVRLLLVELLRGSGVSLEEAMAEAATQQGFTATIKAPAALDLLALKEGCTAAATAATAAAVAAASATAASTAAAAPGGAGAAATGLCGPRSDLPSPPPPPSLQLAAADGAPTPYRMGVPGARGAPRLLMNGIAECDDEVEVEVEAPVEVDEAPSDVDGGGGGEGFWDRRSVSFSRLQGAGGKKGVAGGRRSRLSFERRDRSRERERDMSASSRALVAGLGLPSLEREGSLSASEGKAAPAARASRGGAGAGVSSSRPPSVSLQAGQGSPHPLGLLVQRQGSVASSGCGAGAGGLASSRTGSFTLPGRLDSCSMLPALGLGLFSPICTTPTSAAGSVGGAAQHGGGGGLLAVEALRQRLLSATAAAAAAQEEAAERELLQRLTKTTVPRQARDVSFQRFSALQRQTTSPPAIQAAGSSTTAPPIPQLQPSASSPELENQPQPPGIQQQHPQRPRGGLVQQLGACSVAAAAGQDGTATGFADSGTNPGSTSSGVGGPAARSRRPVRRVCTVAGPELSMRMAALGRGGLTHQLAQGSSGSCLSGPQQLGGRPVQLRATSAAATITTASQGVSQELPAEGSGSLLGAPQSRADAAASAAASAAATAAATAAAASAASATTVAGAGPLDHSIKGCGGVKVTSSTHTPAGPDAPSDPGSAPQQILQQGQQQPGHGSHQEASAGGGGPGAAGPCHGTNTRHPSALDTSITALQSTNPGPSPGPSKPQQHQQHPWTRAPSWRVPHRLAPLPLILVQREEAAVRSTEGAVVSGSAEGAGSSRDCDTCSSHHTAGSGWGAMRSSGSELGYGLEGLPAPAPALAPADTVATRLATRSNTAAVISGAGAVSSLPTASALSSGTTSMTASSAASGGAAGGAAGSRGRAFGVLRAARRMLATGSGRSSLDGPSSQHSNNVAGAVGTGTPLYRTSSANTHEGYNVDGSNGGGAGDGGGATEGSCLPGIVSPLLFPPRMLTPSLPLAPVHEHSASSGNTPGAAEALASSLALAAGPRESSGQQPVHCSSSGNWLPLCQILEAPQGNSSQQQPPLVGSTGASDSLPAASGGIEGGGAGARSGSSLVGSGWLAPAPLHTRLGSSGQLAEVGGQQPGGGIGQQERPCRGPAGGIGGGQVAGGRLPAGYPMALLMMRGGSTSQHTGLGSAMIDGSIGDLQSSACSKPGPAQPGGGGGGDGGGRAGVAGGSFGDPTASTVASMLSTADRCLVGKLMTTGLTTTGDGGDGGDGGGGGGGGGRRRGGSTDGTGMAGGMPTATSAAVASVARLPELAASGSGTVRQLASMSRSCRRLNTGPAGLGGAGSCGAGTTSGRRPNSVRTRISSLLEQMDRDNSGYGSIMSTEASMGALSPTGVAGHSVGGVVTAAAAAAGSIGSVGAGGSVSGVCGIPAFMTHGSSMPGRRSSAVFSGTVPIMVPAPGRRASTTLLEKSAAGMAFSGHVNLDATKPGGSGHLGLGMGLGGAMMMAGGAHLHASFCSTASPSASEMATGAASRLLLTTRASSIGPAPQLNNGHPYMQLPGHPPHAYTNHNQQQINTGASDSSQNTTANSLAMHLHLATASGNGLAPGAVGSGIGGNKGGGAVNPQYQHQQQLLHHLVLGNGHQVVSTGGLAGIAMLGEAGGGPGSLGRGRLHPGRASALGMLPADTADRPMAWGRHDSTGLCSLCTGVLPIRGASMKRRSADWVVGTTLSNGGSQGVLRTGAAAASVSGATDAAAVLMSGGAEGGPSCHTQQLDSSSLPALQQRRTASVSGFMFPNRNPAASQAHWFSTQVGMSGPPAAILGGAGGSIEAAETPMSAMVLDVARGAMGAAADDLLTTTLAGAAAAGAAAGAGPEAVGIVSCASAPMAMMGGVLAGAGVNGALVAVGTCWFRMHLRAFPSIPSAASGAGDWVTGGGACGGGGAAAPSCGPGSPGFGGGGATLLLVMQDVTAHVMAQERVAVLLAHEHRILEALFPRHVIEFMTVVPVEMKAGARSKTATGTTATGALGASGAGGGTAAGNSGGGGTSRSRSGSRARSQPRPRKLALSRNATFSPTTPLSRARATRTTAQLRLHDSFDAGSNIGPVAIANSTNCSSLPSPDASSPRRPRCSQGGGGGEAAGGSGDDEGEGGNRPARRQRVPAGGTSSSPPSPTSSSTSSSSSTAHTCSSGRASGWRQLVVQQRLDAIKVSHLATQHKMVTILFSDCVGFTSMCKTVSPLAVMHFLNELYQKLDALLDIYKVYKVETIGDCYVVAGGLVRYDADGYCSVLPEGETDELHAVRVMEFAKAMLRVAQEVMLPCPQQQQQPQQPPPQQPDSADDGGRTPGVDSRRTPAQPSQPQQPRPVTLRLGMHSGPALSGVVGSKMPRFSVFGETVETAHRMEAAGRPGRIHVSGVTRELLRREGWEQTEGVQVDGRGRLDTYLWVQQEAEEDVAARQRVLNVYL